MLTRPYGAQQPQLLARYPLTDHKVEIIAQFLESFAQDNAGGDDTHTYLEKVGQYLKDEPLVKPVDRSKNPWHNFLEEHPNIGSDIPEILVIDNQASLIQTFETLTNSIEKIFESINSEYTTNCLSTGIWRISCSLGMPLIVWKFQEFFITVQILCEINFGELKKI